MSSAVRWTMPAATAVLLVSFLVWARGHSRHRGDGVGSLPPADQVCALPAALPRG